jgi:hypothetical protein
MSIAGKVRVLLRVAYDVTPCRAKGLRPSH